MPVTTVHHRVARSVAVVTLAVVATACPQDPPAPPAGPSPSLATVEAISPGGTSFSARPMSADGRYVVYGRWNMDTVHQEPQLWDRSTGSSVPLAEPFASGPGPVAPVISSDGSTVYLAASQILPEPYPNNDGRALVRYDTSSGDVDPFYVPDNEPFNSRRVTDVATSADGSVVAVEIGEGTPFLLTDVAIWTAGDGYQLITDHSAIESGAVFGYDLAGSAISENGRFVAVATMFHDTGGGRHSQLDVYDRTDSTWRTAWTGSVTTSASLYYETVRVMSTLDDGSVIFDVTTAGQSNQFMESQGVRLWNSSTGTLSQLVTGDTAAQGWSASPDGRFVGYTGSDRVGAPSNAVFGTPHLLDRLTGKILPSGKRPLTLPIAVGTGAADVLLFTNNAVLNPDLSTSGNMILLWDRS
jgi:hypothetical protein